MQPYNQPMQQLDIFGSAMRGMDQADAFKVNQQKAQQQDQLLKQQNTLFQQQQDDRSTKIASQEASQIQEKQFFDDLGRLNKYSSESEYENMYDKYPKFREKIKAEAERLDMGKGKDAKQVYTIANYALGRGDKETAAKIFREHAEVFKESNPNKYENLIARADNILADEADDSIVDINLLARESFKDWHKGRKELSDINKVDSETKKIKEETSLMERDTKVDEQNANTSKEKLFHEMQKAKKENGGFLKPKEKIDYEIKLSNQYLKEGGQYFERADRGYQNVMNASGTGVGALTTYLSFMKTIDPSSTVTGGEVNTAANAPGLYSSIFKKYNYMFEKGEASKEAIRQFKLEAKNIRDNAKAYADRTKAKITNQVKGTNIDTANIFNAEREEESKDPKYDWLKDAKGPGEDSNLLGDPLNTNGNLSTEVNKKVNRAAQFQARFK